MMIKYSAILGGKNVLFNDYTTQKWIIITLQSAQTKASATDSAMQCCFDVMFVCNYI